MILNLPLTAIATQVSSGGVMLVDSMSNYDWWLNDLGSNRSVGHNSSGSCNEVTLVNPGLGNRYGALKFNYNVEPAGAYAWFVDRVSGGNMDLSAFNYVSFWVKGASGGEGFMVGMGNYAGVEGKVQVNDFLPGGITTNWQKVVIPFKVLENTSTWVRSASYKVVFVAANVTGQVNGALSGTVYIDDIVIGTATAPIWVDNYNDGANPNALRQYNDTYGTNVSQAYNNTYFTSGPYSLASMATAASNGTNVHRMGGVETQYCSHLAFDIRGQYGNENDMILRLISNAGPTQSTANLSNYATVNNSAFTAVQVPLATAFPTLNFSNMAECNIDFPQGEARTVYLDNLRFVDTSVPSAPMDLTFNGTNVIDGVAFSGSGTLVVSAEPVSTDAKLEKVTFEYSMDDGMTWTTIGDDYAVHEDVNKSTFSATWNTEGLNSGTYQVRAKTCHVGGTETALTHTVVVAGANLTPTPTMTLTWTPTTTPTPTATSGPVNGNLMIDDFSDGSESDGTGQDALWWFMPDGGITGWVHWPYNTLYISYQKTTATAWANFAVANLDQPGNLTDFTVEHRLTICVTGQVELMYKFMDSNGNFSSDSPIISATESSANYLTWDYSGLNWANCDPHHIREIKVFVQPGQAASGTFEVNYLKLGEAIVLPTATPTPTPDGSNGWMQLGYWLNTAPDSLIAYFDYKINSLGIPYVALNETGNIGKVMLKYYNGNTWIQDGDAVQTYTSNPNGVGEVHLTMVNDVPYVAWSYAGKACLKHFDGQQWIMDGTLFDNGDTSQCMLYDLASNAGKVYLVCYKSGTRYVYQFDSTGFSAVMQENIDSFYAALAVSNQTLYIAYTESSYVKVKKLTANGWVAVGDMAVSGYIKSFAVSESGVPYLAYGTDNAQFVKHWENGTWVQDGVPNTLAHMGCTQIGINQGVPYLAWSGSETGLLNQTFLYVDFYQQGTWSRVGTGSLKLGFNDGAMIHNLEFYNGIPYVCWNENSRVFMKYYQGAPLPTVTYTRTATISPTATNTPTNTTTFTITPTATITPTRTATSSVTTTATITPTSTITMTATSTATPQMDSMIDNFDNDANLASEPEQRDGEWVDESLNHNLHINGVLGNAQLGFDARSLGYFVVQGLTQPGKKTDFSNATAISCNLSVSVSQYSHYPYPMTYDFGFYIRCYDQNGNSTGSGDGVWVHPTGMGPSANWSGKVSVPISWGGVDRSHIAKIQFMLVPPNSLTTGTIDNLRAEEEYPAVIDDYDNDNSFAAAIGERDAEWWVSNSQVYNLAMTADIGGNTTPSLHLTYNKPVGEEWAFVAAGSLLGNGKFHDFSNAKAILLKVYGTVSLQMKFRDENNYESADTWTITNNDPGVWKILRYDFANLNWNQCNRSRIKDIMIFIRPGQIANGDFYLDDLTAVLSSPETGVTGDSVQADHWWWHKTSTPTKTPTQEIMAMTSTPTQIITATATPTPSATVTQTPVPNWTKPNEVSAFPQPAKGQVNFAYTVTGEAKVSIDIFKFNGERVASIVEHKNGGSGQTFSSQWQAAGVAPGMYLCRIVIQDAQGKIVMDQKKKVALIK